MSRHPRHRHTSAPLDNKKEKKPSNPPVKSKRTKIHQDPVLIWQPQYIPVSPYAYNQSKHRDTHTHTSPPNQTFLPPLEKDVRKITTSYLAVALRRILKPRHVGRAIKSFITWPPRHLRYKGRKERSAWFIVSGLAACENASVFCDALMVALICTWVVYKRRRLTGSLLKDGFGCKVIFDVRKM